MSERAEVGAGEIGGLIASLRDRVDDDKAGGDRIAVPDAVRHVEVDRVAARGRAERGGEGPAAKHRVTFSIEAVIHGNDEPGAARGSFDWVVRLTP